MNKDIVKVGFAVLAAVTTYSFAEMVISAEENDTQPVVAVDVSSTNEIETDASLDMETSDKSEKPSVELVNGWTKDYTQYIKDGVAVTNSFEEINGNKYYFDEAGYKVTGFKTIGDNAYYFSQTGEMLKGLQTIDNLTYYFSDEGIVLHGLQTINGKLYYFDNDTGIGFTGRLSLDNKIYYFDNGAQFIGEKYCDGYWYNFKVDGTLSAGFEITGNNVKYYDHLGRELRGTFNIDKVTYKTDSNGFIVETSWNGVSYYCQRDPQWAYNVVGGYYFNGSGCLPTAATIVINTLKGTNYLPTDIGNILHATGHFNSGGELGSDSASWQVLANRFGLSVTNNLSSVRVMQELLEGKFVTAAVEGGKFCPWPGYSHIIVLFGLDSQGYTTVYDPYTPTRNGRVHISEVLNHPSSFSGDLISGGPFFSISNIKDYKLYIDVEKYGNIHVGDVYYSGSKMEPEVNVSMTTANGRVTLVQGRDYIVTFENNNQIGQANVIIKGINGYTGTVFKVFNILQDQMQNGTYQIQTSLKNNKVLGLVNKNPNRSSTIGIYDRNTSMSQQFYIEKNQNGYYTIKNVYSNQYIGLNTNWLNLNNGSGIIQGVDAKTKASQFVIYKNATGQWILSSAWDRNFVLDLSSSSVNNGNLVQLWQLNNTNAQYWNFVQVQSGRDYLDELAAANKNTLQEGTYEIGSAINSNYVLDMSSSSLANGGNVQVYQSNGTKAQAWKIVKDAKGYITFINVNSGKVMDVASSVASNLTNVQQYDSNGSYAQKWIVVKKGDKYVIYSALDVDYVLDLYFSNASNGSNVEIFEMNGSLAQQWTFNAFKTIQNKIDDLAAANKDNIQEGTYEIGSAINSNYVLDMSSSSMASGGNLQIYQSNGTNAQAWKIIKDNKGYLTIINANSGKVLDVTGSVVANLTNVQQYQSNGSLAQKWIAVKNGSGFVLVSALNPNYALDLFSSRTVNGNNIAIYEKNGSKAQTWIFNAFKSMQERIDDLATANKDNVQEGTYEISSAINTGYVFDMSGSSMVNGGNLQIYQSNGTNAQAWKIIKDNKGYLTIINANSGKVLDVTGSVAANLTNVQQYQSNGTMAQKWIAVKNGSGFVLVSALNPNYALDLFSSRTVNGNNIAIYEKNGSKAQTWIFNTFKSMQERIDDLAVANKDNIKTGIYEIGSAINSKFVLDMSGSTKANGGNLQIYQANRTNAQAWKITKDDKGYLTIRNANSNKVIEVAGAVANLTNVHQNESNGSMAQKWIAVKNGNGFVLVSALNPNYALDLFSSRTVNGNNIAIYEKNGSKAQIWVFKEL